MTPSKADYKHIQVIKCTLNWTDFNDGCVLSILASSGIEAADDLTPIFLSFFSETRFQPASFLPKGRVAQQTTINWPIEQNIIFVKGKITDSREQW